MKGATGWPMFTWKMAALNCCGKRFMLERQSSTPAEVPDKCLEDQVQLSAIRLKFGIHIEDGPSRHLEH